MKGDCHSFHMRYSSMICCKRLQSDRPCKRLSLIAFVFRRNLLPTFSRVPVRVRQSIVNRFSLDFLPSFDLENESVSPERSSARSLLRSAHSHVDRRKFLSQGDILITRTSSLGILYRGGRCDRNFGRCKIARKFKVRPD